MTLHSIAFGDQPYEYLVPSETIAGKVWRVYTHVDPWKCTCPGHLKHHHCKHTEMVKEYLKETEGGREPEEEIETPLDHGEAPPALPSGMVTPPPPSNGYASPPAKYVKRIHGQDFIEYEGLLAMAHAKGLEELGAGFISVTEDRALAWAWAKFICGRCYWEAADATPSNVNGSVKAHFPRVALTRAKARVLRDALNIGMVAVEELEE
jgi:hypothetical protein